MRRYRTGGAAVAGHRNEMEPRLEDWVARGIISAEQAAAIRDLDDAPEVSGGMTREVLAYLGAVLVVAAGFILVSQFWEDINWAGRFLLTLGAGIILTGTGISLASSDRSTTRRAGQFALLLGAAPVGFAIGMLVDAGISDEQWAVTAGFAGSLIYSGVFYARQRSFAQHVALFLSAAGTTIAVGALIEGESGSWIIGSLLIAFGFGWLAASMTERLPPRTLGEVGGILALGIGSLIVVASLGSQDGGGISAMALWIAVSIGLVGAGVRWDDVTLIIGGVVGLLIYVPWLASVVLGGGVGAVSLLFAGALLIGTAVHLSRRAKDR